MEVVCTCGYRRMCFGRGLMQRLHRVPSDTLIYDLQFRLRRAGRGEHDRGRRRSQESLLASGGA